MTHCYGDLPGQDDDPHATTRHVSSLDHDTETINAMPRMTAVGVSVTRCGQGDPGAR
jgi:hypothetical protein